jgi:predicted TIM-barrel fold metal-dependent hydrolase
MLNMTTIEATSASSIRASLDHPIIDADGHIIEHLPALIPHLLEQGIERGDLHLTLAAIFRPGLDTRRMSFEDCVRMGVTKSPWWALPSSALDLATVTAPRLYRKRLDEFGIDFSVVYPSVGIGYNHIGRDDVRVAACRAYNRYVTESFADVRDRIEPAAVVAMNTPAEGVRLLEDAVALGLKTAMIPSYVQRPISGLPREAPGTPWAWWLDTYGIDSSYDYDPFWARCVELGVSVAAHSGAMGTGTRQSPSNYMFNHTGHFGVAGEALARGLFFGGVTERFPELRVAFLEGGVNWARGLLSDLISRWEKRNGTAIAYYDPANTDRSLLASLLADYAPELVATSTMTDTLASFAGESWPDVATDDFALPRIERKEQFLDRFVSPYFFGCEADDPLTVGAFRADENPLGAELSVLFGSDIGHWDVRDPMQVVPEAYEAVENGLITKVNFRSFVYDNARRFFAGPNPAFFAGTSVA